MGFLAGNLGEGVACLEEHPIGPLFFVVKNHHGDRWQVPRKHMGSHVGPLPFMAELDGIQVLEVHPPSGGGS